MSDPGSSMSLAATLVMALVVVILLGAWLIAVFRAAGQPVTEAGRAGGKSAAHTAGPGADMPGRDALLSAGDDSAGEPLRRGGP